MLFFPAGISLILVGMFYEWIDRKLVARFQNRIGPRWFQPFADAVKLFAKEQIKPGVAAPLLFYGIHHQGSLIAGVHFLTLPECSRLEILRL